MAFEVVVVGCSWGGLAALQALLAPLPRSFRAAVAIAQHRGAESADGMMAALLGIQTTLPVEEAEDKLEIMPGRVYLAPPDYHLLVEPGSVALSVDPPLNFSRPSIDVLLHSAADAYGRRVAGVVLTGSNADGALGLAQIAARGGTAIVQDPQTAERREMPDAALRATPAARVLALAEIGPALTQLAATGVESGS